MVEIFCVNTQSMLIPLKFVRTWYPDTEFPSIPQEIDFMPFFIISHCMF